MHAIEPCGLLYDRDGDMRECHLAFNHDLSCYEANRVFRASLVERTRQAQSRTQGPWL